MSDLHVVAVIPVKDGFVDEVTAAMRAFVETTRTEDGCISYDLYESAAAAGTLVTVEVWRDQAALDAHMASPHMAAVMGEHGAHLGEVGIHPLRPVS